MTDTKTPTPRVDQEWLPVQQYVRDRCEPKDNGCWHWSRYKKPTGYGIASHRGGRLAAHRLAYMAFVEDVPEGFYVCHKCDNPSCVNPDHLFCGTALDNLNDAYSKGRRPKKLKTSRTFPMADRSAEFVAEVRAQFEEAESSWHPRQRRVISWLSRNDKGAYINGTVQNRWFAFQWAWLRAEAKFERELAEANEKVRIMAGMLRSEGEAKTRLQMRIKELERDYAPFKAIKDSGIGG